MVTLCYACTMKRLILLVLGSLSVAGCNPSLPNGYSVTYGDRGKVWLSNPDHTIAHGAEIKRLYRDDRQLLLITEAAAIGGEVIGPRPLDGDCYVALLIDTDQERMRQVRMAEADRLSASMTLVESSGRGGCLPGTPTS